jgi:hypothetical protein
LAARPRQQAGTAGGGGSSRGAQVPPSPVHTAQWAAAANLGFILAALLSVFGLPQTLGADRAEENA